MALRQILLKAIGNTQLKTDLLFMSYVDSLIVCNWSYEESVAHKLSTSSFIHLQIFYVRHLAELEFIIQQFSWHTSCEMSSKRSINWLNWYIKSCFSSPHIGNFFSVSSIEWAKSAMKNKMKFLFSSVWRTNCRKIRTKSSRSPV